jgi:hypothetical protein
LNEKYGSIADIYIKHSSFVITSKLRKALFLSCCNLFRTDVYSRRHPLLRGSSMTGFADRFIGVATDWFLYALTEEYLFCIYKRAIVCAAW